MKLQCSLKFFVYSLNLESLGHRYLQHDQYFTTCVKSTQNMYMSNIKKFPEGLEGTTPNFWIYLEFVCLERYTESAQTWGVFPHLGECYNPMEKSQGKIGGPKVILTQITFFGVFCFLKLGISRNTDKR